MKVVAVIVAIVLLAAGGVFLLRPQPQVTSVYYDSVSVEQGDLVHVLRETGQLGPREPVLVKTRFRAKLQWVIEDGSWVEKGDKIYIQESDMPVEEANKRRADLLSARQQLRLAELRLAYTKEVEHLKVDTADRHRELEQLRFKILTSLPQGGDALIRVHEELLPKEITQRKLRSLFERDQDVLLLTQDRYLESQDKYESAKNGLLRAQSLIDQLELETDKATDTMQPDELSIHNEKLAKLKTAREDYATFDRQLPELRQAMLAERAALNELKVPLQELRTQLEAAEVETAGLYIRLEIEKRGLEMAGLQLDKEAAALQLAAATRKFEDGKAALADGAVSQASVDALEAMMLSSNSDLGIIEQRLAISSRPPSEEEVEEARMRKQKAEAEATAARHTYDQQIAAGNTEITLARARISKLQHELDAVTLFPVIIEANISIAVRELELLDPEDETRRNELEPEIVAMRQQLEAAKDNPPHIYYAPVSGVVRLKQYGAANRPTQAGDEWWSEDAVVMLYPPENLEVQIRVNEVNVDSVRAGMPARVLVPSLRDLALIGEIIQVSAIGRDKFHQRQSRQGEAHAGVTEFDVRVRIDGLPAEMRQGMTVVVEIALAQHANAVSLATGAVFATDAGFAVLSSADAADVKAIRGEFFGHDRFIVSEGLNAGDQVWVERRKNL